MWRPGHGQGVVGPVGGNGFGVFFAGYADVLRRGAGGVGFALEQGQLAAAVGAVGVEKHQPGGLAGHLRAAEGAAVVERDFKYGYGVADADPRLGFGVADASGYGQYGDGGGEQPPCRLCDGGAFHRVVDSSIGESIQVKFSVPAAISKLRMAMPRSILV